MHVTIDAITRSHFLFSNQRTPNAVLGTRTRPKHILYALTFDEPVAAIIRHCGGTLKALQRDLEDFFKDNIEQLPEGVDAEPQQALGFQMRLATSSPAARAARKSWNAYISCCAVS